MKIKMFRHISMKIFIFLLHKKFTFQLFFFLWFFIFSSLNSSNRQLFNWTHIGWRELDFGLWLSKWKIFLIAIQLCEFAYINSCNDIIYFCHVFFKLHLRFIGNKKCESMFSCCGWNFFSETREWFETL